MQKIQIDNETIALTFNSCFPYYLVGVEGIAAMQVMRALHTPLQDVTLGSGCKLNMQTCKVIS